MMTEDDLGLQQMAARPPRAARRRTLRLGRVAILAAVVLGAACLIAQAPARLEGPADLGESGDARSGGPIVGSLAPGLVVSTVDGRTIDLTDLRGRPVWLTFGASWCQDCRAENPDIESAFLTATDRDRAATRKDLIVIAVFISEDEAAVSDYARRVGLTYDKVADPDRQLADRFRVVGLPSHFFIDRSGVVRAVRVGSLDPAGIQHALEEILGT